MQCKKGVYFSFDFGFPSILILSVKHGKIYLLTVPKYFHKMLYQTTTNPTKI